MPMGEDRLVRQSMRGLVFSWIPSVPHLHLAHLAQEARARERGEAVDHKAELAELEAEQDLPIEELLARYKRMGTNNPMNELGKPSLSRDRFPALYECLSREEFE